MYLALFLLLNQEDQLEALCLMLQLLMNLLLELFMDLRVTLITVVRQFCPTSFKSIMVVAVTLHHLLATMCTASKQVILCPITLQLAVFTDLDADH